MNQSKARRIIKDHFEQALLHSTKDTWIFVLACRGLESQGGGVEDNDRRRCVYLLLSKIRPGHLSIITPAFFQGFIHLNKRNSAAQESNQPALPLACLPKPVSAVLASYTAL